MKFITTTTNQTQHEIWDSTQAEPDIETPQKAPLPSYTETIRKTKQKRK